MIEQSNDHPAPRIGHKPFNPQRIEAMFVKHFKPPADLGVQDQTVPSLRPLPVIINSEVVYGLPLRAVRAEESLPLRVPLVDPCAASQVDPRVLEKPNAFPATGSIIIGNSPGNSPRMRISPSEATIIDTFDEQRPVIPAAVVPLPVMEEPNVYRPELDHRTPEQKEAEDRLVARAIDGDKTAFTILYDMFKDRIYRNILYRVPEDVAEDLTQQVFLNTWRAIGKYRITGSPFAAWILTITHNLVMTYYRRQRPTTSLEELDNDILDPVADEIQATLDRHKVMAAISKLRPDRQQVIRMRFLEDLASRDVGISMGKSEGAVRVIQHRALANLKRMFEVDADGEYDLIPVPDAQPVVIDPSIEEPIEGEVWKISFPNNDTERAFLKWVQTQPKYRDIPLATIATLFRSGAAETIEEAVEKRAAEGREVSKRRYNRKLKDFTDLQYQILTAALMFNDERTGRKYPSYASIAEVVFADVLNAIPDEQIRKRKLKSLTGGTFLILNQVLKKFSLGAKLDQPPERTAQRLAWINEQPEFVGRPLEEVILFARGKLTLDQLRQRVA